MVHLRIATVTAAGTSAQKIRHGRPFFGVVGSALIVAFMHGINIVFPAALVMGLVGAELLLRSGSVWPAVVVHVVFNLPTIPVMVLAGTVG